MAGRGLGQNRSGMILSDPARVRPQRFEHVAHESPLGSWRFTAAFPAGPLAAVVEVFPCRRRTSVLG